MSYIGLLPSAIQTALRAVFPLDTPRFVGLLTALPANDGTGAVEVAVSGYVRQQATHWIIDPPEAGDPMNAIPIRIGETLLFDSAEWPAEGLAIVGFGVWDSLVGGELLATGVMKGADTDADVVLVTGSTVSFSSGTLRIEMAQGGPLIDGG